MKTFKWNPGSMYVATLVNPLWDYESTPPETHILNREYKKIKFPIIVLEFKVNKVQILSETFYDLKIIDARGIITRKLINKSWSDELAAQRYGIKEIK